ncbi:MAG TPA: helix-turn-helix transcriptional regulator [Solimonas sp.]
MNRATVIAAGLPDVGCEKVCAWHVATYALKQREDSDYRNFLDMTRREQEAFFLVLKGMSVREMGVEMSVSRKTAENHRSRMMARLGLHNAVEVVRFAVRYGMLHAGNV